MRQTNLNAIHYISLTSDNIFNITLRCEFDMTIFVQILEVYQFLHRLFIFESEGKHRV